MKMISVFGKKFFIIILCSLVLYTGFLVYSDLNVVFEKFSAMDFRYIPIICFLFFLGWIILFLRWYFLLNQAKIKIPFKDNFLIYISGFSLSIAPFKSGEFLKSVLLKNKFNVDRTKSFSVIFLERLYDITGALIIAVFGIVTLGIEFVPVLFLGFILILIMLYLIYSKKILFINKIFNRFQILQKFVLPVENSRQFIKECTTRRTVIISICLTILYRLIEGFAIFVILHSFGIDVITYLQITVDYAVSVIIGAVSMFPGGIGVVEGSLAGLLTLHGLEFKVGLIIAVVIRLFALWFSVLAGTICLKLVMPQK